jgi:hypothetical protein
MEKQLLKFKQFKTQTNLSQTRSKNINFLGLFAALPNTFSRTSQPGHQPIEMSQTKPEALQVLQTQLVHCKRRL